MNQESDPTDDPPETHDVPALIEPCRSGGLITPLPNAALIPPLIAHEGDAASWRYVDFFTANIRNPNTRRACHQFFAWCEERGLSLGTIRPFDVSTYI